MAQASVKKLEHTEPAEKERLASVPKRKQLASTPGKQAGGVREASHSAGRYGISRRSTDAAGRAAKRESFQDF